MKEKLIVSLNEKYDNAIAIFGGALYVDSIETLVSGLYHVIKSAKFFEWHAGTVDACRTFCTLCGYDPALVETYIGKRFVDLCA